MGLARGLLGAARVLTHSLITDQIVHENVHVHVHVYVDVNVYVAVNVNVYVNDP